MTDEQLKNEVLERLRQFIQDDLTSIGWWDDCECDIDLDRVKKICDKVKVTIEE